MTDRTAWFDLCESGKVTRVKGGELLAAYDYWRGDRALGLRLYDGLSSVVAGVLRRKIWRSLDNEGNDIIENAASVIAEAILMPTTTLGKGVRKSFSNFVGWRALDALEKAGVLKWKRRPHAMKGDRKKLAPGDITLVTRSTSLYDDRIMMTMGACSEDDLIDLLDVCRALEKMSRPAKAYARMHFLGGDSLDEIAEACNTSRHQVTVALEPILAIRRGR